MALKATIDLVSETLTSNAIDHALIGGIALGVMGVNRATADVDFLVDGSCKKRVIELLREKNFILFNETHEVLQFRGIGYVDFLLANRPLSLKMLKEAQITPLLKVKVVGVESLIGLKIQAITNDPAREYQDKADILALLKLHKDVDWDQIKQYADLFDKWNEITKLRDLL